jgi:hypothetical protein
MRHSVRVTVATVLIAGSVMGVLGLVALSSSVATSVPASATNPARVTRVSPLSAPADTSITVTIHGHGLDTTAGATKVSFGSTPAVSVDCLSPSVCTAVTPNLPVGSYDVNVVTKGDTVNPVAFAVVAYDPPLVRLVLNARGVVEFSVGHVLDRYPAQGASGNDYVVIENQTAVPQSLTTNLLGPATIASGAQEGFSMPADNGPYIFFTTGKSNKALTVDTRVPA